MRNILVFFFLLLTFSTSMAYPIDGYLRTGIRRLLYLQRVQSEEIKGKELIPGALRNTEDIALHLYQNPYGADLHSLPEVDPELDKALNRLFPNRHDSYSITLMDITPGKPVRYASRQEERGFQPGSVGKLAVLTAFFCELENVYPDDFEKRIALLKSRQVLAGQWALSDHHTIADFDPETNKYRRRQVTAKDVFSLYEWIDFMMSVSNNGAASIVWREAVLMREFGDQYPTLTQEMADEYFKKVDKKVLSDQAENVVNEPLRALNIDKDEWRLGTFFTRGASSIVRPQGGSVGTPKGLMKWMLALERGQVIDPKTSLEMKRLMYMTDRRIRYGANKELKDDALYFKSGSLYKCDRNKNPDCKKYAGNVFNYMNSVAIVERPDSVVYLVALMTNVLGRNSNWDHNRLAGQVDQLFPTREVREIEEPTEAEVMAEEARGKKEDGETGNSQED